MSGTGRIDKFPEPLQPAISERIRTANGISEKPLRRRYGFYAYVVGRKARLCGHRR